jgi:hypothetical protein
MHGGVCCLAGNYHTGSNVVSEGLQDQHGAFPCAFLLSRMAVVILERCWQITWARSICGGWKSDCGRFLGCLSHELVIRAKIEDRLSKLVEYGLANEKSDQGLTATSIQLDNKVIFGSTLRPKFEGCALSFLEVVDVRWLRQTLKNSEWMDRDRVQSRRI